MGNKLRRQRLNSDSSSSSILSSCSNEKVKSDLSWDRGRGEGESGSMNNPFFKYGATNPQSNISCSESHTGSTTSDLPMAYDLPITPTKIRSRTRQTQQEFCERYRDLMHCLEQDEHTGPVLNQPRQRIYHESSVDKDVYESDTSCTRPSNLASLLHTSGHNLAVSREHCVESLKNNVIEREVGICSLNIINNPSMVGARDSAGGLSGEVTNSPLSSITHNPSIVSVTPCHPPPKTTSNPSPTFVRPLLAAISPPAILKDSLNGPLQFVTSTPMKSISSTMSPVVTNRPPLVTSEAPALLSSSILSQNSDSMSDLPLVVSSKTSVVFGETSTTCIKAGRVDSVTWYGVAKLEFDAT